MYSQDINTALPNLEQSNHQITSPPDYSYNCIAWAAGEDDRWWWPDLPPDTYYWPEDVPRAVTIDAFVQAFKTKNYKVCEDGNLVEGIEKIALYVDANDKPTHMARQLPSGRWTSKCGSWCDISHEDPEVVADGTYGKVGAYLYRELA